MSDMITTVEQRIWAYLLKNRQATAQETAAELGVPEATVQTCIDRIGSPDWRTPTEGVKYDQGKPRYDLVPPEAEEALARVLTFGAAKYGDRNWELGMDWGRPYAAMRRHMAAWWSGEDNDPETGMPHTWHALCCIAFLATYQERGIGNDNRYPSPSGQSSKAGD